MTHKQKIAIIAPLVLVAVMYPIFQLLAGVFKENWRVEWWLGLFIYWMVWGGIFPWLLIGKEGLKSVIKPQKLTTQTFFFVLFLVVMSSLYHFVPGMAYQKQNLLAYTLLVSSCFGNGFFEEVLWRGVYLELFPDNFLFRVVWPTIWFALWHYAPGSVSPSGNVVGLMIGAGLMGFYLTYIAKKTKTIWWTILAHTLGGLVITLF